MFSRSKNVLEKLMSFLALVWGAANQGRPETVHAVGGRKENISRLHMMVMKLKARGGNHKILGI